MPVDGNAVASIDGKPILNARTFQWMLRAGVAPFTAVAVVRPDDAKELLGGRLLPVDLIVGGQTFRDVYVIEEAPGNHPAQSAVRIADRRWFWTRQFISRSYNIRRTVGAKRIRIPGQLPQLDPIVDDIGFQDWSLKDRIRRFTAREVLDDIFKGASQSNERGVLDIEKDAAGVTVPFLIDNIEGSRDLPIQDLVIEEQGHAAVARVLDYIPGATVTVDPDGTVRVMQKASGDDVNVFERILGPEIDKKGHVAFIGTNDRIRPRAVHVYFTKLHELLFDFQEGDRTVGRRGKDDRRFSQNVLPIPDLSLSFGGKNVSRGTWVPIDERLFTAWGPIPGFGLLTFDKIERWLTPRKDIWSIVKLSGAREPNADWMGRLTMLEQHFRRTYRINPLWRARIKQWYPFLVSTVDVETGERAPAKAFLDYTVIPTERTLLALKSSGEPLRYDLPFKGYSDAGGKTDGVQASPAKVRILDQDQGIFSLEFQMDEFRVHQMLIPGLIENSPTAGLVDNAQVAWNLVKAGGKIPKLAAEHGMSVIISAQSGSPNRRERLYRMTVKAQDVDDLLPNGARAGLTNARGPDMHVRVGPGLEQARVAWIDRRASDIETSFGVTPGSFNIDDLILNRSDTGVGASLNDLSKGIAARIYAGFADRHEGAAEYDAVEARLEGWIESMAFSISHKGVTTMKVKSMDRIDNVWDPMAFMPSNLVNFIERIASPQGSPT